MKSLFLLFTGIICCISIQAQEDGKKWTLEECILYAIEHNIDIKQRALQKENAEINLHTSKMSRLPDLNGSVGNNWNSGWGEKEDGLMGVVTQSRTSLSISSNTPIFTGFRIKNEVEKNEFELDAAMQDLEKAKENLSLNVASLYLQALLNKELLKVSKEQLELSLSQVKKTEILVESGKVPTSQLYDIKAQVAKDEVSLVQRSNELKLSLLDLAQSLELESVSSFDIEAPESERMLENSIKSILPPDLVYNNAITFKPQVKEQELLVKSTEKSLNIAKSGYLPTLNLGMGYQNSYNYNYDIKDNYPFSKQIKEHSGEYIGLSLNIPIFNRFSVKNQVRSARLNIKNQQLTLDNTKKTLYKEIQTAYLNATAAQEKYRASSLAVTASSESFKYAQERYESGKSTVFEFDEAKNKLTQSLSEQIQAKYDYIFRSKILDFYNGNPIVL